MGANAVEGLDGPFEAVLLREGANVGLLGSSSVCVLHGRGGSGPDQTTAPIFSPLRLVVLRVVGMYGGESGTML